MNCLPDDAGSSVSKVYAISRTTEYEVLCPGKLHAFGKLSAVGRLPGTLASAIMFRPTMNYRDLKEGVFTVTPPSQYLTLWPRFVQDYFDLTNLYSSRNILDVRRCVNAHEEVLKNVRSLQIADC